ncbi:hypothetical protein JXA32_02290 [Candidatus Sumerlaeota bacterium]|nr:hypothetical protein [Candidatus Sumerlaeota bacterium]
MTTGKKGVAVPVARRMSDISLNTNRTACRFVLRTWISGRMRRRASSGVFALGVFALAWMLAGCGEPEQQDAGSAAGKGASVSAQERTPEALAREAGRKLNALPVYTAVRCTYRKQLGEADVSTTATLELTVKDDKVFRYWIDGPGLRGWRQEMLHVSDGEQAWVYNSLTEEYWKEPPRPVRDMDVTMDRRTYLLDPFFIPLRMLLHGDAGNYLMMDVREVKRLDGEGVRLWLDQPTADMLLCLDPESGLPTRLLIDFLKQSGAQGFPDEALEQAPRMWLDFRFTFAGEEAARDETQFVFRPEPGMQQVMSPAEWEAQFKRPAALNRMDLHLLGRRAYPFRLDMLDGEGERQLREFRETHLLIYFFNSDRGDWRQGLRELDAVTRDFVSERLRVVIVDRALTSSPLLPPFLESLKNEWIVLRDPNSQLREHFNLEDDDRLVLLDEESRYAYFYDPPLRAIEPFIQDHLKRALAGEAIPVPRSGLSEVEGIGALELAWQPEHTGVTHATVHDGMLYWCTPPGKLPEEELEIPGRLCYARMDDEATTVLLRSAHFGKFLPVLMGKDQPLAWLVWNSHAQKPFFALLDGPGEPLYSEKPEHHLLSAAAVDVNSDGVDELLLGFNAHGGVALLDWLLGERKWQRQDLINAWSVGVMDANADGAPDGLSVTFRGPVQVFDLDEGNNLAYNGSRNVFDPDLLTMRVLPVADFGRHERAVLCAGSGANEELALMDAGGELVWREKIIPSGHDEIVSIAAGHWGESDVAAAVSMAGELKVFDAEGALLYHANTNFTQLGMTLGDLDADGSDELVLWGPKGVKVYRPVESWLTGLQR